MIYHLTFTHFSTPRFSGQTVFLAYWKKLSLWRQCEGREGGIHPLPNKWPQDTFFPLHSSHISIRDSGHFPMQSMRRTFNKLPWTIANSLWLPQWRLWWWRLQELSRLSLLSSAGEQHRSGPPAEELPAAGQAVISSSWKDPFQDSGALLGSLHSVCLNWSKWFVLSRLRDWSLLRTTVTEVKWKRRMS